MVNDMGEPETPEEYIQSFENIIETMEKRRGFPGFNSGGLANVYHAFAQLLVHQGKYDLARKQLESSASTSSEMVWAWHAGALLFKHKGNIDKVKQEFNATKDNLESRAFVENIIDGELEAIKAADKARKLADN